MFDVDKKITIDLNRPTKNVVHLGQNDNTHIAHLVFLKDGVPFAPESGLTGVTKSVKYIASDGSGDENTGGVTIVSGTTNEYTVALNHGETAVPGFTEVFVVFSKSGNILHTFPITLDVIKTDPNISPSESSYGMFLRKDAQDAKTSAMTVKAGIDENGTIWVPPGGGGEVTPEAIVAATGDMSVQQAANTRENIGAGTYSKPQSGIPSTHFAEPVQTVLSPVSAYGNVNLLNPNAVVSGYIAAAGQINNSDSYWTSDYFPVSAGDVIRVSVSGTAKPMAFIGEYSTESQAGFIVRSPSGSYYTHTVANNGYARVSVKTSACALNNVSNCMFTLNSTDLTFVAYGASTSHDGIMTVQQAKKLNELWNDRSQNVKEPPMVDGFRYVAYSGFGGYKGNSKEFFDWVFPQDFEIIKCDTRPTSDGKLVLCHDPGWTLDGNGKITTYDSSNYTAIRSMTYAQCMALEFNNGEHVCDIDYYLSLCKTYSKIPYITVRDEYADDIASALKTSLTYFGYHDNAIINSSTSATLTTVRNTLPNVTLCIFCNPFGSSLVSALNYSMQTTDCIMSYYYSQSGYTWADFIGSSDVQTAIATCNQLGIRQCIGIEGDETHIADIIAMGMDYCHYMASRPIPEYATKPTVVTITGSTPTIALAEDNKIYKCTDGAITAITITAITPGAEFAVKFNAPAGNTPPTFTYPTSYLKMPKDFALEVNTHYELNVDEDGYVVVGDVWEVTS